ncbi:probable E3 ubiquitin-protein ligase HERC6 [Salvelinus fontinalis]|uniref:probable E3 ubiquitin-protein ligase HERC6 n=1 Tax=Salvelinus fontinalis TaxID=8038 RepID=UPI0024865A7B|nr:probable E3 ubiquitin-protein ligase HERC6 [Salvelinus fontinalis]
MTKHIGVWKKALLVILKSKHIQHTRGPWVKHLLQVLGHLHRDSVHASLLCLPSQVYLDEDARLTDVYKRDFFLHVFDRLLVPESGMFMYNDTKTLAWFPAKSRVEETCDFLFGVLCGMALYNNHMVHFPFPMAFFKKLVNIKPSLEDLREFSPIEAGNFQYILDYPDDDVENMDMTFSVMWGDIAVDLVTSANKQDYSNIYY